MPAPASRVSQRGQASGSSRVANSGHTATPLEQRRDKEA